MVNEGAIQDVGGVIFLGKHRLHKLLSGEIRFCRVKKQWVGPRQPPLSRPSLLSKTASSIKLFLPGATLHPEVVHLGQKELDEVIGGDGLPGFSDKPRLSYITAVAKEVLRRRQPSPLGTVPLQSFIVSGSG